MNAERHRPSGQIGGLASLMTYESTRYRHLLFLLGPKADIYFTVPRRVKG